MKEVDVDDVVVVCDVVVDDTDDMVVIVDVEVCVRLV